MNAPATPLRLLLVENSEADAALLLQEFQRTGLAVEHRRVQDAVQLQAALAGGKWDAVICDYAMPGFSASAALDLVGRTGGDLPFLVVAGSIPEGAAVELMRQGAHDYLLKDNLVRLVPATLREIKEAQGRDSRRRSEQALRESAERLRLAQQIGGIGVFDVDLVNDYSTWTEEEEAIFGFDPGTFDHKSASFWPLLHPDDRERVRSGIEGAMAQRSEINQEYRFYRRNDHALRWLVARGKVYYDESGRPVRFLGVNTDITERKQAEEVRLNLEAQLRQGQKMEAIGQLSGGVAHDFNNMLTVILGNIVLIELEEKLPAEVIGPLDEIKEAAKRAANLTRQLLAFSRKQPMHLRVLDLNAVVAEMTRMLRRILGEDIQMQLKPSPQPADIRADAGMIEQVLLNLAVNARDAMPGGGQLTIGTEILDAAQILPPAPDTRSGKFVCLTVRDTGCGIPAENLPHICEPFFTTKDVGHGTGLGLATVYGIVEQHGGWLQIDSVVGQGTGFRIYLPNQSDATAAVSPPGTPAKTLPAAENRVILLVEDEVSVRAMARTMLKRQGYRVLEAATGPAAVELWLQHRQEIDLVLTDLVMPDGMSGLDLARRLREDDPALQVIYTSGYSPEIAGKKTPLQEGVNFLAKPYDHGDLLRIVDAALRARETGSA